MGSDRGAACAEGACRPGCFQQTAALLEDVFKQGRELIRIAEGKQFLDVSSKDSAVDII